MRRITIARVFNFKYGRADKIALDILAQTDKMSKRPMKIQEYKHFNWGAVDSNDSK
jgi:hypothetical protein